MKKVTSKQLRATPLGAYFWVDIDGSLMGCKFAMLEAVSPEYSQAIFLEETKKRYHTVLVPKEAEAEVEGVFSHMSFEDRQLHRVAFLKGEIEMELLRVAHNRKHKPVTKYVMLDKIVKSIYDYQQDNEFDTFFDFLLEDIEKLTEEVRGSVILNANE